MARWKLFSCLLAGLLLAGSAGCVHSISKQWRDLARNDLTFQTVLQDPAPYVGAIVIWGGIIVQTENGKGLSDIVVLQTPLNSWETPGAREQSQGRFIARSSIFLDPAVFLSGRRVTVAGEIVGKETRRIDKLDYGCPVVTIKEIYLWHRDVIRYSDGPFYYADDWYWEADSPMWPGNALDGGRDLRLTPK